MLPEVGPRLKPRTHPGQMFSGDPFRGLAQVRLSAAAAARLLCTGVPRCVDPGLCCSTALRLVERAQGPGRKMVTREEHCWASQTVAPGGDQPQSPTCRFYYFSSSVIRCRPSATLTGEGRMANQSLTGRRFLVLAAIGLFVAILLAEIWKETAAFPWSSDPWLMNTALGIMLAGPLALIGLAIIFLLKRKK